MKSQKDPFRPEGSHCCLYIGGTSFQTRSSAASTHRSAHSSNAVAAEMEYRSVQVYDRLKTHASLVGVGLWTSGQALNYANSETFNRELDKRIQEYYDRRRPLESLETLNSRSPSPILLGKSSIVPSRAKGPVRELVTAHVNVPVFNLASSKPLSSSSR